MLQIFNILILEKFGLDLKFDEEKMDNYLDSLDDHLKEDTEDTESEVGEDYLKELNEINNEWQDNEYRDARLLLSCLNKETIGIFKNWRDIGIFLFSLTTDNDESYLKLWLDLAERSCKFTSEHCMTNWGFFKRKNYKSEHPLYALHRLVKSISPKKLEAVIPYLRTITPNSNTFNQVSNDGCDYDKIKINQIFLTDNYQFNSTVK